MRNCLNLCLSRAISEGVKLHNSALYRANSSSAWRRKAASIITFDGKQGHSLSNDFVTVFNCKERSLATFFLMFSDLSFAVRVHFKLPNAKTVPLEMPAESTIAETKRVLGDHYQISMENLTLIQSGKVLEDQAPLINYSHDTIHVANSGSKQTCPPRGEEVRKLSDKLADSRIPPSVKETMIKNLSKCSSADLTAEDKEAINNYWENTYGEKRL